MGAGVTIFPTRGHIIDAGSGAFLIALAVLAMLPRPRRAAQAAFALFAASFGLVVLLGNLASVDDPAFGPLQNASGYASIPAALGLVLLALNFPRPLTRSEAWTAIAAALPVATFGVLVKKRDVDQGSELFDWGIGRAIDDLQYFFYFVLLLWALRFVTARGPTAVRERLQYAVASLGLAAWPLCFLGIRLAMYTIHPDFSWDHPYQWYNVGGIGLVTLVAAVWFFGAARTHGRLRGWASTLGVLALALPVVAAIAYRWWAPESGTSGINGVARGITVLVLGYAILRHQLFDIDLRVKWTVEKSLFAAALALAYFAAAGLVETIGVHEAAPWVGVAAVGLLLVFTPWLRRAARGVVDALMPNVQRSPEYLNLRRLDVYRAALDHALLAGTWGRPGEEKRLARLRADLGLNERDHAILLHAAQTGATHRETLLEVEAGALLLDRYRVVRLLGDGSQGRTYLVRDEHEDRDNVVKVIRHDLAGDKALAREARSIAALEHPNVVRLLGVQESRGLLLLVMEYVPGGSLGDRLKAGPLSPAEFRTIAADLLGALSAVHAAGIVHRDVKPSNVLLTEARRAKLADFGVARVPGLETTVGPAPDRGAASGTIRYMSPEQAKGKATSPRSDLFSAAATLYEAYSGRPYMERRSRESAIELQLRAASAGPFRAPLRGPPKLRSWFVRALHPTPERRFGSAEKALQALEAALAPSARVNRR